MALPSPPSGAFSDRLIQAGIAFLVLLFVGFLFVMANIWMVTAGSVQVESELKKQLPELIASSGTATEETAEVTLDLRGRRFDHVE